MPIKCLRALLSASVRVRLRYVRAGPSVSFFFSFTPNRTNNHFHKKAASCTGAAFFTRQKGRLGLGRGRWRAWQFLNHQRFPYHAHPSARVDLQGNAAFARANFGIGQVDDFVAVYPAGDVVAIHFYLQGIPAFGVVEFVHFWVWFHEPAAPVGFIDKARAFRGNFHLPAVHLDSFYVRADKNPAIAVALGLKLDCQDKVFVVLVGLEVAVVFVGAAFAHQQAIFDKPFFRAKYRPAIEVFPVEQGRWLARLPPQGAQCRQ